MMVPMASSLPRLGKGLRLAGAVLVLPGGFGLLLLGLAPHALAAILAGAAAGTLGAALEAGGRRPSWRLLLLPPVLLALYLYDAVALLLGLPFILLALVLGPLAMLAGLVSLAMLAVFLAERAFGDIRGLSGFETWPQALAGAGVVLLALASLLLYGALGDEGPVDCAARVLRRAHDALDHIALGLVMDGGNPPPGRGDGPI